MTSPLLRGLTVYVAGPYTAPDPAGIRANVLDALDAARLLLTHEPRDLVVPHVAVPKAADWQDAMVRCSTLLGLCDAAVFLPSWYKSAGARLEYRWTRERGIPSFFIVDPFPVEEDWTEVPIPLQPHDETRLAAVVELRECPSCGRIAETWFFEDAPNVIEIASGREWILRGRPAGAFCTVDCLETAIRRDVEASA